jgi:hypothetical protein
VRSNAQRGDARRVRAAAATDGRSAGFDQRRGVAGEGLGRLLAASGGALVGNLGLRLRPHRQVEALAQLDHRLEHALGFDGAVGADRVGQVGLKGTHHRGNRHAVRCFQSRGAGHERQRRDQRQRRGAGANAGDRGLQLGGMKLGLEVDGVDAGRGEDRRRFGEGGAQPAEVRRAAERNRLAGRTEAADDERARRALACEPHGGFADVVQLIGEAEASETRPGGSEGVGLHRLGAGFGVGSVDRADVIRP